MCQVNDELLLERIKRLPGLAIVVRTLWHWLAEHLVIATVDLPDDSRVDLVALRLERGGSPTIGQPLAVHELMDSLSERVFLRRFAKPDLNLGQLRHVGLLAEVELRPNRADQIWTEHALDVAPFPARPPLGVDPDAAAHEFPKGIGRSVDE